MNSKDPAPHITCLFGAGASFSAMPVQNELATEMHAMLSSLYALKNDNRHAESIVFIKQKLGDFIQNHSFPLKELAQEALDYQSVDTLAKVLTIQGTEQRHRLSILKECVDLFFHLQQFHRPLFTKLIKLSNTYKEKKTEPEYREKDREDKRYMALLASIMKTKVEHPSSLLPDNTSILSYNYDVCLEEALAS